MNTRNCFLLTNAIFLLWSAPDAGGQSENRSLRTSSHLSGAELKVMAYSELEEAFRAVGAEAGISLNLQDELLAQFKNVNGRRLVPGMEVRALLLEQLYEKAIRKPGRRAETCKHILSGMEFGVSPVRVLDTEVNQLCW